MKTFSIFFISLLALSFGSKAQMSQVEGQSPSRAVSIKKANYRQSNATTHSRSAR